MPQNDNAATLAKSKSVLAHANAAFPSSMAPKPAQKPMAQASLTHEAPEHRPVPSDRATTRQQNIQAVSDVAKSAGMSGVGTIGTLHNGGPVTRDGAYNLKKGEHVLTEPEAKQARKHALMASGIKSLAKTAPKTAGEPAAKKSGSKKTTTGITVRPEKKQAAKIVDKTKK